jgi:asparagine synthase (glutamine-hydrolysing)
MCGIAGIIHNDQSPVPYDVLRTMADSLTHRGPDAHGYCIGGHVPNPERLPGEVRVMPKPRNAFGAGTPAVGLAHRRLSIIDLSGGAQPLCNEDGTVWVVFNGEIYNFMALRSELIACGHRFQTASDTETIVHAWEEWGERCLARLNGMFAFAIWDGRSGRLFIARDRIGKKPLYYLCDGDRFLFGSELKAILAHPGVRREIDPTAVADYFKYLYVPDPKTIYRGIRKLPPAHYLLLERGRATVHPYWDVSLAPDAAGGEKELAERLLSLLQECTTERLVSEVPLGAFLSGGVDSSGIVALMARSQQAPPVTCCIGFDDPAHDESPFAREVAALLGTDHREYVVRDGFSDLIAALPGFFDEPFADSSALPTYCVCHMARRAVTVAISGDGGDESFGGYHKYVLDGYERLVGRLVPRPLLSTVHALCSGSSPLFRRARTLTAAAAKDPARAYYETNTFVTDHELAGLLARPLQAELKGYDPFGYTEGFFSRADAPDHLSRLLYTDLKTYLPGDILVKVDRMSMANSLEVRSPLLDYRVVEFAAALPAALKIRRTDKKYLLKKAFGKVLPEEIFRRPKHGFTVPLDRWFRSEIRELAQRSLLGSPALAEFLDPSSVRKLWDQHQRGEAQRGQLLWSLLMFALWHRNHEETPHA